PDSYIGPSDFRKAGQLPPRIQTRVSGGCFPTNGANAPRMPPMSTLMTYRMALWLAPPGENESPPSAGIASFTNRGPGAATTMEAGVDCASDAIFLSRIGTMPLAKSGGSARRLVAILSSPLSSLRSEEHTSELQSLTNLVCRL